MKPTFYIDSEIKDIKVGQKYNFTLLAIHDKNEHMDALFESPSGMRYYIKQNDYVALSLENGTKNTETAPKYDPCRRFRKGDKVEYLPKDGRELFEAERLLTQTLTVVENEHEIYNRVEVKAQNGDIHSVPFYYLKLVTPVEEQERYILIHNEFEKHYEVCWKDDDEPDGRTGRTRCRATFWYYHPPQTYTQKEAKAAAEAERDRLNAEYRKEQS